MRAAARGLVANFTRLDWSGGAAVGGLNSFARLHPDAVDLPSWRALGSTVRSLASHAGEKKTTPDDDGKKSAAPPPNAPPHSTSPPARLLRNFSIIAHVDHGKSTLADRLLSVTGTVSASAIAARGGQWLDGMDLERERGITIKLNQARMEWTSPRTGETYVLNLIDTPGHVDFSYEVSRSLAACEGALLVVDASQGVQAQTLAVVNAALENDVEVIPVLNKIDLPGAEPDRVAGEIREVIGLECDSSTALRVSAKQGIGIEEVLEAVVSSIPPPPDTRDAPLRALIFDSSYDPYRGVIVFFRVVDGVLTSGDAIRLMNAGKGFDVSEVGVLAPGPTPVPALAAGEVGYLTASIKAVADVRVGDTITHAASPAEAALPGYREASPMVYCGLFPSDADAFPDLKEALGRLKLNDAALSYEAEVSPAMGCGFRCGFLGLLHMEVVQERLEREYGLDLVTTAPTVVYRVTTTSPDGATTSTRSISNPADIPDAAGKSGKITLEEPFARVEMITPAAHVGPLIELATSRRGEHVDLRFLSDATAALTYDIPLAEVVSNFFDEVKGRSKGYASLEYSLSSYRPSDLVRLDIKINGEPAPPLACIVHKSVAYRVGRGLVSRLKALIPRHQFRVPLQACVGSRVLASEAIPAMRKDVLAKCYGGDVSRKKKLLAKQAKGKKRMKAIGRVEVPQEAFMAVLAVGNGSGGGADD